MPTKKKYPNHNKPWLPEVEQELAADYENGASLKELVHIYGRTKKAIVGRLQKMGSMSYDPDEMDVEY